MTGDAAVRLPPVPLRAWLGLMLLTAVAVVASCDKALLGIVLTPIKAEFGLSDTQLGLLSGPAFAIAQMLGVLPFGMLADRVNRRTLVACAVGAWSLACAAGGAAQSFGQMLGLRAAVGLGEAAGQSAQITMISDLFPPARRATAVSIYYASGPLSIMAALLGGGWVVGHYGWRAAFYAAAVPGLILAGLMFLMKEPVRGSSETVVSDIERAPLGTVLRYIGRTPALGNLMAAMTVITVVISGVSLWTPSFFVRIHGYTLPQIGGILGIWMGIVGLIASPLGGLLSDHMSLRDPRWRLWLIAIALGIQIPLLIGTFTLPPGPALVLYIAQSAMSWAWLGLGISTSQNLMPPGMRATGGSILFMGMGLIGFGFGPQLTGLLSDLFGDLRMALIAVSLLSFWGILHLMLATRTLTRDLAAI